MNLKLLHDELYILKDEDILRKTLGMIRQALSFARENGPKEKWLALKDKSLSPVKRKSQDKKFTSNFQKLRKESDKFVRRVGIVAEQRRKKVQNVEADSKNKETMDADVNNNSNKVPIEAGDDKKEKAKVEMYSNKNKRKNTRDHQEKRGKLPKEVIDVEKHLSKFQDLEVWVKINGSSLGEELRHVLLHPLGWLTDD